MEKMYEKEICVAFLVTRRDFGWQDGRGIRSATFVFSNP